MIPSSFLELLPRLRLQGPAGAVVTTVRSPQTPGRQRLCAHTEWGQYPGSSGLSVSRLEMTLHVGSLGSRFRHKAVSRSGAALLRPSCACESPGTLQLKGSFWLRRSVCGSSSRILHGLQADLKRTVRGLQSEGLVEGEDPEQTPQPSDSRRLHWTMEAICPSPRGMEGLFSHLPITVA